ncbi:MAG TPA: ABC transporter permease [Bacteroidales bacterium]|nr:ABC transporter permease [Bacteroidales bacterium]
MRTILFILQKEFIQIRRNRMMLPVIFVVPLIQLLILVNAANMEMKHIKICIVDNDLSSASRFITGKFSNSKFFVVQGHTFSMEDAQQQIENGRADMVLHIPAGFERNMIRENKAKVQLLFNAINGTVAGISSAYAAQIIAGANRELIMEWYGISKTHAGSATINIIPSFWFNPDMNYKIFMVPAILVLLVTLIGMMLATLNIVREKEMGNIEQINVTPIRKIHFITGKLLPFWIIALVMLAIGLIIGKLIYNIPMLGSLPLLFAVAGIYLLTMLGFGLMISNSAATQQQAMFVMFFFILIFIMMSGIFTPTDSMPQWAQTINYLNPVSYFMRIIRMILLKGSGFMDILRDFIILLCYGIIVITLAVFRYRKVS